MRKSARYPSIYAGAMFWALAMLVPNGAFAHGGGTGVDLDVCRIPVDNHWVHFTAYQPQLTGGQEFCNAIPGIGQTTIVFDYEDRALRDMTVEFEITKEPEGARVFYQAPTTVPTGTFTSKLDLGEKSKYLVHVTLVNEGKKTDAHIPLNVGSGGGTGSSMTYILVAVVVLGAAGYIFRDKLGMKSA